MPALLLFFWLVLEMTANGALMESEKTKQNEGKVDEEEKLQLTNLC